MRSDSSKNCVPRVPAAQFTLDQTHKCLLKLRWVGKKLEAQTILEALDDARMSQHKPDRFPAITWKRWLQPRALWKSTARPRNNANTLNSQIQLFKRPQTEQRFGINTMPSHVASQKRKNISAKHTHSGHTGLATMAIFPGRQGPLVDGAPVPPAAEFHEGPQEAAPAITSR